MFSAESIEIEKQLPHIIIEIIEYIPMSTVIKTIIMKTRANVSVCCYEVGEEWATQSVQFDTYIQMIAGQAEIKINDKKIKLVPGSSLIIPSQSVREIYANQEYKMLATVIKG